MDRQDEKKLILKRNKILKNQLAMFCENDILSETFFQSIDTLNENSIFTKRIDKNKYFYAIIDAMGSGLNSSITALNVTSFLNYLTQKEFNFKEIIKDFVEYTKLILIDDETLSANFIYIQDEEVFIANFGMPSIYADNNKIPPNNLPIRKETNDINIQKIDLPKKLLFFSDGIIEANLKDSDELYLLRFKEIKNNITFLKDLIKDFKQYADQNHDIVAVLVQKDTFKTKQIFNIEKTLHSLDDINEILDTLYSLNVEQDKILFIFQELLMNTYEHNMIKLSTDKEILMAKDKLKDEKVKRAVKIKINISENDELVKIAFYEENRGLNKDIIENLRFKKYHGKGLKIISTISDAIFMSEDMQYTYIFIKKSQ